MGLVDKLFGSYSAKELKRIRPQVDAVLALEDHYRQMDNKTLQGETARFKELLANGKTLDDILPEAFAACREAADRVLGMRHFPVQVMGGIILHQGRIAEMKTGEGKTLVATLPAYLNALSGKGVHVVTVNEYLARRDSEWMGNLYRWMGLTVGLAISGMSPDEKRAAYAADITYGTNNEFGFDYLRDNMVVYKRNCVQRGWNYAIVDEVDSILIDEARTPLIISGAGEKSTDLYEKADRFAATLTPLRVKEMDAKDDQEDIQADYIVDEKARTATITPQGARKAEQYFGIESLNDPENLTLAHHINQAIAARGVMQRDIDYVVKDGEVIIVDEFTGRLMLGRRYSDGLHQAIEAKEHVRVQSENKTLATITFQNYFRLYGKLSGMTGTAMTEEEEFAAIYNLDIIEIPTNKPVIRIDNPDVVYKNEAGKLRAIIEQIRVCHEKGQPVLVGTVSIEKSEQLSKLLRKAGIPHNVLNAKHHEKEAEIVAQAGKFGAVTIATNMAGRGTDIMLGGNAEYLAKADLRKAGFTEEVIAEATGYAETEDEEILKARTLFAERMAEHKKSIDEEADRVRAAGGLYIIGTERHESRRIDNQLRGRSGRQGDPGESRFYIALTDDVMRLFGSERMQSMMETLRVDEDTPLDHKMLSNAIEQAQRTVESRNFQARKNVLEYDDVMNVQRNVIYEERRKVLDGEDLQEHVQHMIRTVITGDIAAGMAEHHPENDKDLHEILAPLEKLFPCDLSYTAEELHKLTPDTLSDAVYDCAMKAYAAREEAFGLQPDGTPLMRELERVVMLRVVDEYWMDHLEAMDDLRQGIGLRAYGNVKPVDEYKRAGFDMFDEMVNGIQSETVRRLFTVRVRREQKLERKTVARSAATNAGGDDSEKKRPVRRVKKPGRNDPCPCGKLRPNGLPMKYKDCCGKNA